MSRSAPQLLEVIHHEVSKTKLVAWRSEFLEPITNYMRPLVTYKNHGCKNGQRFATITPDGRRVVVLVTAIGNLVVFDRGEGKGVVVSNAPKAVSGLWSKPMSAEDVERVLGFLDSDHNMHHSIQAIYTAVSDAMAEAT